MKTYASVSVAVALFGISALVAGSDFGAQGSGGSADNRNDNFVVVCHYDRNQEGPNAGPHTITINANALDHHLLNHVKAAGFVGDDHIGACPEATPVSTFEATATPTDTPTATPTDTPTATPTTTDTPTATPTFEPTLEPTAEATATPTSEPD